MNNQQIFMQKTNPPWTAGSAVSIPDESMQERWIDFLLLIRTGHIRNPLLQCIDLFLHLLDFPLLFLVFIFLFSDFVLKFPVLILQLLNLGLHRDAIAVIQSRFFLCVPPVTLPKLPGQPQIPHALTAAGIISRSIRIGSQSRTGFTGSFRPGTDGRGIFNIFEEN